MKGLADLWAVQVSVTNEPPPTRSGQEFNPAIGPRLEPPEFRGDLKNEHTKTHEREGRCGNSDEFATGLAQSKGIEQNGQAEKQEKQSNQQDKASLKHEKEHDFSDPGLQFG